MNDIIFSTEILTEFELTDLSKTKVRAIVITLKETKNLVEKDLMGRSSKEYVLDALSNYEMTEIVSSEPMLDAVKPYLKDEEYTIILYSDTPLVRQETISDALEYAISKNTDFCKLPRGAIVKTSAIKLNKIELSCEANFLNKQDFFYIFNLATLSQAREKMRQNILSKLSLKVEFDAPSTCYIDDLVEIKKGVHIGANCVLRGATVIGENCKIGDNSVIENCKIGDNCVVESSFLKNVEIKNDTKIPPFTYKEKK